MDIFPVNGGGVFPIPLKVKRYTVCLKNLKNFFNKKMYVLSPLVSTGSNETCIIFFIFLSPAGWGEGRHSLGDLSPKKSSFLSRTFKWDCLKVALRARPPYLFFLVALYQVLDIAYSRKINFTDRWYSCTLIGRGPLDVLARSLLEWPRLNSSVRYHKL